jgi:hypothetical protein
MVRTSSRRDPRSEWEGEEIGLRIEVACQGVFRSWWVAVVARYVVVLGSAGSAHRSDLVHEEGCRCFNIRGPDLDYLIRIDDHGAADHAFIHSFIKHLPCQCFIS